MIIELHDDVYRLDTTNRNLVAIIIIIKIMIVLFSGFSQRITSI